ncbi:MAG: CsbD family protein [Pirellulaceae bacterium]
MALNTQTLQGHWQEIKGKVHEKWGAVTDDDLQQARGNVDQLVGAIQRRTGETREQIRKYLDGLVEEGASTVQQAAGAIRGYAESAAESFQGAASQAQERMQGGMRESRQMIRQHPFESVMTCFGVGVLTGVMLGILMRPGR